MQPINDRSHFIRSLVDVAGTGLELSPSYNPIFPKAGGFRIETADYATAGELRVKYQSDRWVDISRIEDVDYVCDGASIAQVIGKQAHYDFIVASHVIEHIPDLLGFLKNCQTLLKPAGRLILVVPDKRYCFDVFQTLTGTGEVLQAHLERRSRHTPGQIFEFIAYRGMRNNAITWSRDTAGSLDFEFTLEQAQDLFARAQTSDEYHDIHGWRFTPSSFRLMVKDLNALGAVNLRETIFHDTSGCEFFMALSQTGAGCPMDRLTLLHSVIEEQKDIRIDRSAPGS